VIQKILQAFAICSVCIVFLTDPVCLADDREQIDFEGFSLSVPGTFLEIELPKAEGDPKMRLWVGEELDETFYPAFSVTSKPTNNSTEEEETSEALRGFMSSVKARRRNWRQSEIKLIKRNGSTFALCSWEGEEVTSGIAMRGLVVAVTGDGARAYLSAQSLKDDPTDFLKKCYQSMLTIERKNQEDR
jgi:hypothetical protein